LTDELHPAISSAAAREQPTLSVRGRPFPLAEVNQFRGIP